MSLASLVAAPLTERGKEAFAFDHDMAHDDFTIAESVAGGQSIRQYMLDPANALETSIRAGNWNQQHQDSHNAFYLSHFGVGINQNMMDSNLSDQGSLEWWTFVNLHEHFIANQIT